VQGGAGSGGVAGAQGPQGFQGAAGAAGGDGGALTVHDTRNVTTTPETINQSVRFDFKSNASNGLSDGGTYFGLMTFRQYGSGSDWTGGRSHQLGFTDNDNVWNRSGTGTSWGGWSKFFHSGNLNRSDTDFTGRQVYAHDWFRTYGERGLYSESYGQHFYPDAGGFYWECDGPIRHRNGNEGAIIGYSFYHDGDGKGHLSANGAWWLNQGVDENGAQLIIGGHKNANAYNSGTGRRLLFCGGDTDARDNYFIGTNLEDYGGNYNKLDLRWHTGIRMGAQLSYGGIRFFNSEDLGTLRFHIEGTSGYLYKYAWLYTTSSGFYSDTNGAHLYPNTGSYGAWRIDGSRNSWGGIELQHGNDGGSMSVMSRADTYGFHYNGVGWRLYVESGSLYIPGDITAYWSDRRLKENIKELERGEGLNLIYKLKPSRFNWKKEANEVTSGVIAAGKEEVSIIAQETQEILPDAVVINRTAKRGVEIDGEIIDDYLTVNYDKIAPYMIQAIKDLKDEIENLKEELRKERNLIND
jgi:hypothetical protein